MFTKTNNMSETSINSGFHGIILYDIELDGRLNGVYTNYFNQGCINNEILRPQKVSDKLNCHSDIDGPYDCSFFDVNYAQISCELQIKLIAMNSYSFEWKDKDCRNIFEGVGYKMNNRQIAVHYWSCKV
jgi:hypothetical protein